MDTHALASIGHNSGDAPLAELLAEETTALRARADELIAHAARAVCNDEVTAGQCATLIKMMKACGDQMEDARNARKKPFLEAGKTIDGHFKALRLPLCGDGPKLGGEAARILALVDNYRREQDAKAAAERRRIEEEARKAEAEARAAEEAARQAGQMTIENEIAIQQQRDRAAALAEQAKATTATPIVSDYGAKATARTTYKATITDLTVAIRHARKIDEAAVMAAIQAIYDRQARAGVRELPGATVEPVTSTVIR